MAVSPVWAAETEKLADVNADSNISSDISATPFSFREKPIGYQENPPGWREEPLGFREQPPNFIEKDSLLQVNTDPDRRISIEAHPLTSKSESLRISAEDLPQTNKSPDLRLDRISGAKED